MISPCKPFVAARSLLVCPPFPISRSVSRMQYAARRPLPLVAAARTTKRSSKKKASNAETAVAAVKAWVKQNEDDLTPLYAIFLWLMVAAMSLAAAAVTKSVS
ncbi:hypothetical protein ABBQ38_006879 [Trebouxia sp. C0009 RCD-2024]